MRTLTQRIAALALAVAMIVTFMPIVSTGARVSAASGDTTHEHAGWTKVGSIFGAFTYRDIVGSQSGDYYLIEDMDVSNELTISGSGTVINLCLNGHKLKYVNGGNVAIHVESGATLNLYDTDGSGKITRFENTAILNQGTVNMYGGQITEGESSAILNQGTVNMYGGQITGNVAKRSQFGGGICNQGTLNLYGGSITNNTVGDVSLRGYGGGISEMVEGTLNVYGPVTITGNKAKGGSQEKSDNVNLRGESVINVLGVLTGSSIGVNNTGIVTSGYNTYNPTLDPATVFTSDLGSEDYKVVKSDNEVLIGKHTHDWTYEANGNTVSAYCSNSEGAEFCEHNGSANAVTLTIAKDDDLYSGQPTAAATVTNNITAVTGAEASAVTYVDSKSQESTEPPTEDGKYTAKVSIGGKTASKQFEIKKIIVNVTFDPNGGKVEYVDSRTIAQTYGSKYQLPQTILRAGYDFKGWFTGRTGGTEVTADSTVDITQAMTLYAHWEANQYAVHFDLNGAPDQPAMPDQQFTYDEAIKPLSINTYVWADHLFVGWASDPNATVPGYGDGAVVNNLTTVKDGIYTLYALWKSDSSVSDIDDQTYTGSAITPEPTVVVEGKTLTKGTDYKLIYANNTAPAAASDENAPSVTVQFDRDYSLISSVTKKFNINKKDLSTATITLGNGLYETGEEQTQSIESIEIDGLADGVSLSADDYDITGTKGTEAGAYEITLTAKEDSNFTGTATKKWAIAPSKDSELERDEETGAYKIGDGSLLVKIDIENTDLDLKMDEADLIDMLVTQKVITGEDLSEIAGGTDAQIMLSAKDVTDTLDAEDKARIDDAASAEGYTVGQYVDIQVAFLMGGHAKQVFTTMDPLALSIEIPENLINNDPKVTRSFIIIRDHDSEAELLDTEYDDQWLNFESDKFSTYTIAYKDASNGSGSDDQKPDAGAKGKAAMNTGSPKTGDASDFMLALTELLAAFTALGGLMVFEARRKRTADNR